jgi:hypothetical protein
MVKSIPIEIGGEQLLVEVTTLPGSEQTSKSERLSNEAVSAFQRARARLLRWLRKRWMTVRCTADMALSPTTIRGSNSD